MVFQVDAVFLSPPWGGPGYLKSKVNLIDIAEVLFIVHVLCIHYVLNKSGIGCRILTLMISHRMASTSIPLHVKCRRTSLTFCHGTQK